ncbi:MAG: peptidase family protein [Microbacteriaceae bacterium]|jgi:iron uptake system component EfeO|nr:peptidase family protein [Microbacteriaceae bacterium]
MSPAKNVRSLAIVATIAAAAFALAGCASTTTADTASSSSAATQIAVTLNGGSQDTCELSATTAKAGPVTFTVTNKTSTAITEVELLSADRIIGEKENLAPGLSPVKFTVTLGGGNYQVYCPGAVKEMQTLVVSGQEAAAPKGGVTGLLKQGTDGYAKYVSGVLSNMTTAVANLNTAVQSGDVAQAKTEYALARPYYERIESDVDGFALPGFKATDNAGNLDYLIDMRASNLDPVVGWHGFHAIERDLWQGGAITDSTKQLSTELVSNVAKLNTLAAKLTYKPEDLANGAASLLEEVQTEKIKGEEEDFSHLDLIDFAANVEGAQQAFAFLEPGMKKIDPDLTKQVNTQFANVTTLLDKYKDPTAPGGYVTYTAALKATDAATLSQAVQALQDPLSKIAEKVATAQ